MDTKERTFSCSNFENMSEMMKECWRGMVRTENCCSMMQQFREKENSETNNQGGKDNE